MLIECGKYPLCMKVYIQIIRYWIRLKSLDNKYMQEMLEIDLQKKMDGKGCWLKIVEYLMKYVNYDINDIGKNTDLKTFQQIFEKKLKETYEKCWSEESRPFNESKLIFLSEYKRNFMFESYIDNLNFQNRKAVSKLRLSDHNFPIEKLRYENKKREERLCEICNLNDIGNETHYMICCQNNEIVSKRKQFTNKIVKIVPELSKFNEMNLIKYCLLMADINVQYETAVYINEVLDSYKLIIEEEKNNKYVEILI